MSDSEFPFLQHAMPSIQSLQPYVPGKPIEELERELGIRHSIKLASNENPLGVSPKVTQALMDGMRDVARYPDGSSYRLRHRLAEMHGRGADAVTLGNGSNDVLDMLARVFLGPGDESLFSEYAFAVYPLSSQAVGAKLVCAPARDYAHDLEALQTRITPNTRVIWIANPNNPTGTWLGRDALHGFLARVPADVIVVIDEAYFEYVEEADYPDATQWLDEFPNLVVTRTFSKAYGLAGLRVGYALSHPVVADLLNRVRQPFNVNLLAQCAALAALDDPQFLEQSVAVNRAGMAQLREGLETQGVDYIPSVGNFLTLNLHRDAAEVDRALLQQGVITRPIAGYGLPNHLRVSIGLEQENARFLTALREVLGQ
ncbi:MAG: histidinol-phosphate transaminase [Candidatus Thiodiazotropha sp.]|jgi:histidinol-phosphate aminotransferase